MNIDMTTVTTVATVVPTLTAVGAKAVRLRRAGHAVQQILRRLAPILGLVGGVLAAFLVRRTWGSTPTVLVGVVAVALVAVVASRRIGRVRW